MISLRFHPIYQVFQLLMDQLAIASPVSYRMKAETMLHVFTTHALHALRNCPGPQQIFVE